MSSNLFAYWLFHALTFERKVFSKIHESKSKKSLRETREYRCLLVSTDAEAARAGTDGYTDRQTDTHTQTRDNYSNPRACAPRVNQHLKKLSEDIVSCINNNSSIPRTLLRNGKRSKTFLASRCSSSRASNLPVTSPLATFYSICYQSFCYYKSIC